MRLRPSIRVSPLRRTCQKGGRSLRCGRTRLPSSSRHVPSSSHPLFLASRVFPWRIFPLSNASTWAFGSATASALSPACWPSRIPCGSGGVSVPSIPLEKGAPPGAACSAPGGAWRRVRWRQEPTTQPPRHCGQGSSCFPSFDFPTLPQVSVCQHRSQGEPRWSMRLDPSGTWSASFPPNALPGRYAGRFPLLPPCKDSLPRLLLDTRTGAPRQDQ